MNDTLKVAGRIGAELGAAKAENDRLRGLLQQVVDCQAEHYGDGCGLHLSMITLAGRIKDALSQQAEPADTYTAVDMATAAAQAFRDGQAAVDQAPAQDEREAFEAHMRMGGYSNPEKHQDGSYVSSAMELWWQGWKARATRPAQTEQQPEKDAQADRYTVGDLTYEKVFKAAGLTNLSDLQAVLDAVETAIAQLEQGGWISVEVRLPEPGMDVLVYTPPQPGDWPDSVRISIDGIDPESDGDYWVEHGEHYEHWCCIAKGGDDINWHGPSEKAPYTHWMPLPDLPAKALEAVE